MAVLLLPVHGIYKKRTTLFSCRPIRHSPPPPPLSISAPSEHLSFSSFSLCCRHSTPTLQGKSHLCIPFLGIARPQSLFPHSCVCEQFIYSIPRIGPHISLQQNKQTDPDRYMIVGTGVQNIIILF
jgi:hypothetical protein